MNTEKLKNRIASAMNGYGFETALINGEVIFVRKDKYVRIICGQNHASLEVAECRRDAENNMYDDIDIYEYGYMNAEGFTDDGIAGEIISDIDKYILN